MQLIVNFVKTYVFNINSDDLRCGYDIKKEISLKSGIFPEFILIKYNGKIFDSLITQNSFGGSDALDDFYVLNCSINHGLKGGKGGFGAALRAASRQQGKKRTTDFGALRDLSGRRLRSINDEILLQKWQEAKDNKEEFDVDASTSSGMLCFLLVVSWLFPLA